MTVKKMAAGMFKAKCLAVIDEVQAKHVTVVITKRGKPVAKLVPIAAPKDDIYGFYKGKIAVTGDIVSPVLSREEWGNLASSCSIGEGAAQWEILAAETFAGFQVGAVHEFGGGNTLTAFLFDIEDAEGGSFSAGDQKII